MSLLCTRMSSVLSLVCTRMPSVCHSYVVLPWTCSHTTLPHLEDGIADSEKAYSVINACLMTHCKNKLKSHVQTRLKQGTPVSCKQELTTVLWKQEYTPCKQEQKLYNENRDWNFEIIFLLIYCCNFYTQYFHICFISSHRVNIVKTTKW